LPEEDASKALADLTLLSHKVPIELFEGRRTLPHDLFARDDVEVYLDHLREAVDVELSALGESGSIELFAFTKRLAHRMGLASWGGMIGVSEEQLDALATHFEQLDGSESFVHPHKALLTIATRKFRERRAMHAIEAIFADILREREQSPANGDSVLDSFSHEAIRMSQRSIVLRRVVSPVEIADERVTYRVEPGTLIATMLSVTNQSAAAGLDEFNEKNYRGATFLREKDLPARELVTTYGHGKHTCPAHRFSTSAIRHSVGEIFRRYELTAQFDEPLPLRRQIGGVARADRPCVVRYVART
jgi:cytochrome P450